MRGPALIFVTLMLAGCASSETVLLRNAAGMTAQCGPYQSWGNVNFAQLQAQNQLRDCVADFQRQGYERTPN